MDAHESDRLNDQYVKPLEATYDGQFVGVSRLGEIVFGSSLLDAVQQASTRFSKDNSVFFRVGDKVVGRFFIKATGDTHTHGLTRAASRPVP
jgi:hypothetical protein